MCNAADTLYHSVCDAAACFPAACNSAATLRTQCIVRRAPSCRAERLEIFDEFEEWNMIQVHVMGRASQTLLITLL
jgi:hypothetical protein